ncbi:Cro/CI family transcriptional regulator [Chromobacterium subtsugae]|uniref:Cro/CI family transcriptional regulator n=1 Tax=Chromobacterium subtsugae TaxID=251747 RepID=UPI003CC52C5B
MRTAIVVTYFGDGRGVKSRIAKSLGVSTAAVAKWGELVPDGSAYQLIRRFPELDRMDKEDWAKSPGSRPE